MTITRDIVVIGASAGGLVALCKLTASLPARFPAAILVAQRSWPGSPRTMDTIVGRGTPLSVAYGQQGDAIEPGCIYIAPPDFHMIVIAPGFLGLRARPKMRFTPPPPVADRLFETAAEAYGPRVIGVVLTGFDSDGTDGLRAIKAAGGMAIVQDPAEAMAPSMPLSALHDGQSDYCVSLDAMGPLLVALVKEAVTKV